MPYLACSYNCYITHRAGIFRVLTFNSGGKIGLLTSNTILGKRLIVVKPGRIVKNQQNVLSFEFQVLINIKHH